MVRGAVLGFCIGILPGGSAVISSTMSYAIEKKISKHPEKFGTGIIEGVAGPESANNSSPVAAFIPLLSLGIPTNPAMALLLASLMFHGISPGPLLISQHSDVFWSVIASMYLGNFMLLVLNLPLIGIWVKLLKIPYSYFFPFIFLFCLLGTYSLRGAAFDVGVMVFFGIIGFLMRKFKYEPAPLILAFLLGPMFEEHSRRSLIMGYGSFLIFFERPISAIFIFLAILLLLSPLLPGIRKKRKLIPLEE